MIEDLVTWHFIMDWRFDLFFYHLTLIPVSHPIYIDWRMVASRKKRKKKRTHNIFTDKTD